MDNQLFFDHGPDSFLSQVIGIIAPEHICIIIGEKSVDPENVRIEVQGAPVGKEFEFHTVQYGRSYGEALFKVREELRVQSGR